MTVKHFTGEVVMSHAQEDIHKQFYRVKEISCLIGLKRTSIYALIERGALTKPLKVGRASLWPVADVQELVRKINAGELGNSSN